MPTITRRCDRLDCFDGRRTTRVAANSVQQVAGSAAPCSSGARRGLRSPVLRHAALGLSLWLAACAAPNPIGPPPYHTPDDADIGHAGGGGGGGGM